MIPYCPLATQRSHIIFGKNKNRPRQRPTLAGPREPTTIGAGGLNGRVRDGNGWGPASMGAGEAGVGRSGPHADGDRGRQGAAAAGKPGQRSFRASSGIASHFHEGGAQLGLGKAGSGRTAGSPGAPGWVFRRRRVGVVKPLGCWDRSAATLTRRARPAHRPGRLPGASWRNVRPEAWSWRGLRA